MILSRKDIGKYYGQWFKYTYYNNGVACYVYCHNHKTLDALLEKWQGESNRLFKGAYQYSTKYENVEMTIEEILIDQNFSVKCMFQELTISEYIK